MKRFFVVLSANEEATEELIYELLGEMFFNVEKVEAVGDKDTVTVLRDKDARNE